MNAITLVFFAHASPVLQAERGVRDSLYCRLAQVASLALPLALWAALLGAAGAASAHENFSTDGKQARAALNFTIIIPAVMRILENSHPTALVATELAGAPFSALQRLVLVSTLGKGFCMDMRLTLGQIADWQIKLSGSAGTRIEAADGGYRLCIARAGRYEVALQHDFSVSTAARANTAGALQWPVNVSLATP